MPPSPRAWRLADRAVIALLLAATGLPLAGTFCRLDLMPEGNDMRRLAGAPTLAWDLDTLRSFHLHCEDYLRDHFGFRGPLIRALAYAKVFGLGASSSANVALGRDGWLYYTSLPPGSDHEYVRPFTPAELERWGRALQGRKDWLRNHGCRYVLFVPPDKQTIYPEHLDPTLRPRHASGRLGQLVEYLRAHTDVTVLDVRDALRAARQRERVYSVTDSHWNDRGAFVGYRELARVLSGWFPSPRPLERSQFADVVRPGPGGDVAGLLDLRDALCEDALGLERRFPLHARRLDLPRDSVGVDLKFAPPVAFESPDTSLPRAVLFHDSFGVPLLPLVAEHFQRLLCVWHDDFLPDVVEREHPDVVIQQFVERKLGYLVPPGP
jgi:hypothetical protein